MQLLAWFNCSRYSVLAGCGIGRLQAATKQVSSPMCNTGNCHLCCAVQELCASYCAGQSGSRLARI